MKQVEFYSFGLHLSLKYGSISCRRRFHSDKENRKIVRCTLVNINEELGRVKNYCYILLPKENHV